MIYDEERGKMYIKGKEIEIGGSKGRKKIVEYLIENRGRWRKAEEISKAVYGKEDGNLVRVEIKRIREKLGEEIEIKNKRCIGYRIEVKSE